MTTNSPNPVDGDMQALNVRGRFTSERFLTECLKPEKISGEKQRARIEELMMWFDRYYLASANPKWLRGHVAELCYYIMAKSEATLPDQLLRPVEKPTTKCIGWVKESIQEHDEKWIRAIREAGYEVKS
ncbi:hypothetical protein [Pantoea ananatis]|uniref:hypothetical protein n=1 Tax=Pantoea ananas TaxID=553 RepID=UPI000FEC2947|nr:hypothetical protein [Pantoea ananatis]QAB30094.1 hypothetical protein EPK90_10045 [Pantoea ananatis]